MTKKTTAASSLWSAEWKLPTEEVEQVLLASSFIFKGVKGYVRLQKTKIKDFILNTYIFFENKSVWKQGLSSVAWLTTFNTGK